MRTNWQTLKDWAAESRAAGCWGTSTGNHHLFLIATTVSQKLWIILLGQRQKNFPFFGTHFDNTTLFNVTEGRLYHELISSFQGDWRFENRALLPFSLQLKATPLRRRKIFPVVSFDYHCLTGAGQLEGEPIRQIFGFSEQGHLSALAPKDWHALFNYHLEMRTDGSAGWMQWNVPTVPGNNFCEQLPHWTKKWFLKDSWYWGPLSPTHHRTGQILATTKIPLGDYELQRDILKATYASGSVWFGLRETFCGITPEGGRFR